ncbi:hypothetical protein ACFW04_010497 [Cataglyphis niger]
MKNKYNRKIEFPSHSLSISLTGLEPDFAYPLENVTIPQGRDATFTCVVNNLGGYRVAWIKADTKAILAIHEHVITNNARLSVTHSDYNTWTLNIRAARREDRGIYMCQVNTDPMKSQVRTKNQKVVIPPDIISEETSNDMMVPEGGSAKLVCKARGYPKPDIVWKREDGTEIISRAGVSGGKTKIHPMVQVPNQLVGAPIGTNVTLVCHVEASPKAINYWTRESDEMIISNSKYAMSEIKTSVYSVQMRLVIMNLQKHDLGGYKCISKNSIGDAEGNIRLYARATKESRKTLLTRKSSLHQYKLFIKKILEILIVHIFRRRRHSLAGMSSAVSALITCRYFPANVHPYFFHGLFIGFHHIIFRFIARERNSAKLRTLEVALTLA